jgi:glycosyltransferase involved in cell wall biosynthesis
VYVLEQLARHLADALAVNVAVRRGPARPIEGVRVFDAPNLSAEELPDAELVIGGLAQPDPERVLSLPPEKGTPLFAFQGIAGNPRVRAMLEGRPRVLAVSSFLLEQAQAHDCEAELARPGLERSLFYAGIPCAERKPIVAMVTHADAGKAMDDGLRALRLVQQELPGVELLLYGAHPPDPPDPPDPSGPDLGAPTDLDAPNDLGAPRLDTSPRLDARFLGERSRAQVGELLRAAAVFVCSSHEEGLGLPGIEALACGAALASTDTKGSRDYAIDGATALVTPTGQPELLAQSVITLLRKPQLRERLANQGQAHVLATYPAWPQAAERFAAAAGRLLREHAT